MPIARVRTTLFAVLVGCALLAGCDNSGSQADVSRVSASKPKPTKAPNIADQMVAAVSKTRSATVIGVYFSLGRTPTVHQPLPVDIVLVPHEKLSKVVGHFDGQDGIAVVAGDAMEPRNEVEPESTLKHQLVLLPTNEGVFMVTASIETEGSEGTVSRIFSIPVIVAPAAPEKPAAVSPAPSAVPGARVPEGESQASPAS
jgi:hypothetical protein